MTPPFPRRRFVTTLGIACLLTLVGCGGPAKDEDKQTPAAESPGVPVEVAAVEIGSIARSLHLTGTLSADDTAEVTTRVEGLVREVRVEIGDPVAVGDVLVVLDAADIDLDRREVAAQIEQAALAVAARKLALDQATSRHDQARAEEDDARGTRERQDSLYERNLIAAEVVEKTRLAYRRAQLESEATALAVEQARTDLELEEARARALEIARDRRELEATRHTIVAPIAGVTSERHVEPHDRVMVGKVVVVITRLDRLLVDLRVPEASAMLLAAGRASGAAEGGLPAILTSDSRPGLAYTGIVERISPVVDPTSGTVVVRIALAADAPATIRPGLPERERAGLDPSRAVPLAPGMFVHAAIEVERHENVRLVPKRALVYDEGTPVVYVVTAEGRARRISLRGHTGLDDEWHIETDHPELMTDARVIVIGQSSLKDGSRVTVVDAK